MSAPAKSDSHRWSFHRAGGVDQVRLESGADILNLDQLDQKLWVALSCPVQGLEMDVRTLELLDEDGDAYVRPPEILGAVRWLRQVLQNGDGLAKGEDGVRLANLRKDTAEGKAMLAAGQQLLKGLGRAEAGVVTVADATATAELFAKAERNGDGVVQPEAVADAAARAVATEIVACCGGVMDRSGKPGFDQAQLDAFFAACADFDDWHAAADGAPHTVLPFGSDTAAAHAAFTAVRAKVDDWFGRCKLAAFDPRALAAVNREEAAYIAAAARDLTITASEVSHFPLALVEANKPLPLTTGVNPAWAGAITALRDVCLKGKTALTEAEWAALCAKFDGYAVWLAGKRGGAVEGLGRARVQQIRKGNAQAVLQQAIADDLAVAAEFAALTQVEKLARLHRDFARLLRNYVSFSDFYRRLSGAEFDAKAAVFLCGRLYLDARTTKLCFHVRDAGKHGTVAPMSRTYLAYVDCTRPGGGKMQVACAFTAGGSDNLFVGRNGIFYDRQGRDWNATIVRVVDNPISVGQAFWSPYKKLLRWIEDSINKRAAAADADANAKLQAGAAATGDAAATGKAAAAGAPQKKMDIGVLAAISVAISGITMIVGTMLEKFFGLGYLMPLGLIGLMLLISGPSMLIAWMKLRQRNLGPILDANGWAVNALTRINIPLGGSMTEMPRFPAGSSRSLQDPYAAKKSIWPRLLLVLLLLGGVGYGLYRTNVLHGWLPDWVPPHHKVVDLRADKTSAAPGEVVTFTVQSGANRLAVTDTTSEPFRQLADLTVDPGSLTASLKIEATQPPGTLVVMDTVSGDQITITVAPPK